MYFICFFYGISLKSNFLYILLLFYFIFMKNKFHYKLREMGNIQTKINYFIDILREINNILLSKKIAILILKCLSISLNKP